MAANVIVSGSFHASMSAGSSVFESDRHVQAERSEKQRSREPGARLEIEFGNSMFEFAHIYITYEPFPPLSLFSNEAQHLVSIFTLLPTLSLCLARSGVSD